jgi:hypothetical protein
VAKHDGSNKRHLDIQGRQARTEDEARDGFLNHAMGVVDGRMYFHNLLVRCHVFANPFHGNANVTAFNCGEFNVGQQLLADIMRVCPDEYVQMMREANARSIATDTRINRSDEDQRRHDSGSEPIAAYVHPGNDERAFRAVETAVHDDYDLATTDEDSGED